MRVNQNWVQIALEDIEEYGLEWAEDCYRVMVEAAGTDKEIVCSSYLIGIELYKANERGHLDQ